MGNKNQRRKSSKKSSKKTHKGCDVHTGPRGGKFIMVRRKDGRGTRREYLP